MYTHIHTQKGSKRSFEISVHHFPLSPFLDLAGCLIPTIAENPHCATGGGFRPGEIAAPKNVQVDTEITACVSNEVMYK